MSERSARARTLTTRRRLRADIRVGHLTAPDALRYFAFDLLHEFRRPLESLATLNRRLGFRKRDSNLLEPPLAHIQHAQRCPHQVALIRILAALNPLPDVGFDLGGDVDGHGQLLRCPQSTNES